ncbi:MAG: hypothetical protein P4L83_20285 [Nevskia sp.]|nr:hypothetical protein [Nevskia sp.]
MKRSWEVLERQRERRFAAQQQHGLAKKVLGCVVLAIPLIGFFPGLFFSNIIPSELTVHVGLGLATFNGVALASICEYSARTYGIQTKYEFLNNLMERSWFRIVLMGWVGFMFWYGAAAWGYPWLINLTTGSKGEETFTITGWMGGGRVCFRPGIGHGLFRDGPRALCMSQYEQTRVAVGSTLEVKGRSTLLGINADEVHVRHTNTH